jgi:excisionase family DNA binding protein
MVKEITADEVGRLPDRLAFPVAETAQLLGIGKTKTRELIKTGQLVSIRTGRRLLVPRSEIEAYIARRLVEAVH